MADTIPPGAVLDEDQSLTPSLGNQAVPAGAIPEEQYQAKEEAGTTSGMLKTAVEQAIAGATLGASKALETKGIPALGIPAITTPEAIKAREETNPITATLANIGGTGALIAGTGGIGALAKGATVAGRVGLTALEGLGIGGVNEATDEWSQNKPLDAQKIAAASGLGALLGAGGGALGEGLAAKFAKPIAGAPESVSNQFKGAAESAINNAEAPIRVPETGVQPTSYQEIIDRVKQSKYDGTAQPLPKQIELDDAVSRVPLETPVNPLQREALASQEASDIYQAAKEAPGEKGSLFQQYEALQKGELVRKTDQEIQSLAPTAEVTSDAVRGGKIGIEAFTKQYQEEKKALAPIFENLKSLPVQGEILTDSIKKMTGAIPELANMFQVTRQGIEFRPYKTAWGIDKATYNAVKEAVTSLQGEKNTLQTLWNVRKGLDQHVDVLTQGQAPREIRTLKAALMDQMQESSNNPTIREAFKRYSINEQQRQVIEGAFGASVGTPELGQISKVKPEYIGDKIFSNTATTEAAKKILPPDDFKHVLANWIAENKAKATDAAKNGFSSNKFGSFLRNNQDVLNIAFQDNPKQLQALKDYVTIMRILPDAPSVNPSGTAKTLSRMILDSNVKNLTWEGMLAYIPKKIAEEISNKLQMNELNSYLSGKALKNSESASLKAKVEKYSDRIDGAIKKLFVSGASQARKMVK